MILVWGLLLLGLAARPSRGQAQAEVQSFPGDLFGFALDALEDLDGDGVEEILIGAPASRDGAGTAWVVSGATGRPLLRFEGKTTGSTLGRLATRTGRCARGLGDLDGDGVQDIGLGSPGASGGGALDAFSGACGRRLWRLEGADIGFNPGRGLARMDDLDGDGCPDVAVLADSRIQPYPRTRIPGFAVHSGRDGRLLAQVVEELALPRAAAAIASAGDVDGDGVRDVMLSGTRVRGARAFVEIRSGRDLRVLHRLEGGAHDVDFGASMAAAGDVDRDGFGDVLVGAPRDLYTDARDEDFPVLTRVFSGASGRPLHAWRMTGHGMEGVGCALAGAGDVDGDGHEDLLVGSTTFGGMVELRSGRTGGRLRRWLAPSDDYDDYQFGRTVASVGDLDGDCCRDVAIGSVNVHASYLPSRVEVHSVRRQELLFVLTQAGLEAAWAEQQGAGSSGEER